MKTKMTVTKLICILFILCLNIYAEDSKQIFLNATKPLRNADSYEVDGKIVYSINSEKTPDKPTTIEQTIKVISKGDNQNFLSLSTEQGNIQVFRNGDVLTIYSEKEKKYIDRKAPENVKLFMLLGAPDILDRVIFGDTDFINSLTIKEENTDKADGKEKSFQVQLDTGDEFKVWLSMNDEPRIVRVQTELRESDFSSGGTMDIYFNNWKINSVTDESVFKFSPPPGVSKVEPKKEVMLGKKAPDFTLSTLDGKKISLKDYEGKKVVVIDFWATWCGPCRMAMPILQEVYDELKDKDVVFLAVNVGEEKSKVENYIKKINYPIPVLLDTEGRTATAYNVQSIPRLVIIGKDGIVKGGHTGVSGNMKEELKKEILEILK